MLDVFVHSLDYNGKIYKVHYIFTRRQFGGVHSPLSNLTGTKFMVHIELQTAKVTDH